ncbi:WD40-repeat-containing domain protein [Suillus discolor]|uniref:WD40-repeat-containing domain protein n=1 Tax=Suillus discolor TaxID=1912936 RepID=A0A9P7FK70_9AGAM|nr:WD40-repeat-containing domain protein [Suillus discolor]KAG2119484.1 WD40-repeat-containing domain protein [Suillus discolor]
MTSESLATQTIQEAMSSESESSAMPSTEEASPQPQKPTPKHEFEVHNEIVMYLVFLHDNVHIVSYSDSGTMCKWNCNTGLLVGEPWGDKGEDERGGIAALVLSPDGKTIVCGRYDGSVERWDTDGNMIEGEWAGHDGGRVKSLSWSPSGDHIASGTDKGMVLIHKTESGEIEVGPIETNQDWVGSLAYSPSGDKIASGGWETICIWDTKTGQLMIGPICGMEWHVVSLVWSSDSTKLYSASYRDARVFDSRSGTELHRFEHDHDLDSIALSPKYNVLACVGDQGIAQLWDTESYQPLGEPFSQDYYNRLHHVSFSRDGRYITHGGDNNKITLWMVKDIAPELPSPLSSCLNVDATNPLVQSWGDDYGDFFQSYHPSVLSGPSRRSLRLRASSARHLWNVFIPSRHHPTANEAIALQQRPKRSLFARYTGPQPVTVAAARKKERCWIAPPPKKTNARLASRPQRQLSLQQYHSPSPSPSLSTNPNPSPSPSFSLSTNPSPSPSFSLSLSLSLRYRWRHSNLLK